jgi:hypothetical protein
MGNISMSGPCIDSLACVAYNWGNSINSSAHGTIINQVNFLSHRLRARTPLLADALESLFYRNRIWFTIVIICITNRLRDQTMQQVASLMVARFFKSWTPGMRLSRRI